MADLSRRQLFAGAAGVAVTGSLAACGSSGARRRPPARRSPLASPSGAGTSGSGVTGGGSKDIMDGQNIITKPDQARLVTAFETLLVFDDNYQLTTNGLAESVTQDNPKQYTIKLRQGIDVPERQDADGRRRRLLAAAHRDQGERPHRVRRHGDHGHREHQEAGQVHGAAPAEDRRTRRSRRPSASYTFGIVPTGYEAYPAPQIGTGAYKLKTFTPGQQSVHERNPNYWRSGQPYFDTVTITDFSDSTAQVNGLLGGQIDAMTDLPRRPGDTVLQAAGRGGRWSPRPAAGCPICMAIDMPPFDDVRGPPGDAADRRPAGDARADRLRLRVSRQRPLRAVRRRLRHAPRRSAQQDIEQAKSLLKSAGKDGLSVDLHTTNGASGMVELASVFASQAKAAGVDDQREERPELLRRHLPQAGVLGGLLGHPRLPQPGAAGLAAELAVQRDALAAEVGHRVELRRRCTSRPWPRPTPAKRIEIEHQMQQVRVRHRRLHHPLLQRPHRRLRRPRCKGLKPSKGTLNLESFGHGFRTIWFA